MIKVGHLVLTGDGYDDVIRTAAAAALEAAGAGLKVDDVTALVCCRSMVMVVAVLVIMPELFDPLRSAPPPSLPGIILKLLISTT